MINTDLLIIGAGPTGLLLFLRQVYFKIKCHIIDALPTTRWAIGRTLSLRNQFFDILAIHQC